MRTTKSIILLGTVWALMAALGCGGSEVDNAREFIKDGKFTQAVASLNERIAQAPEDADAHFLLGVARINTGQLGDGDASFATATRLKSDYGGQIGREYKKAGDVALQEGNTDQAVSLYDEAVRYQPDLKTAVAQSASQKGKDVSLAGNEAAAIELHHYAMANNPLLGMELGQWYAAKATTAESASAQADLNQLAQQFDATYKAEVARIQQATAKVEAEKGAMSIRARMKNVIAQRLDERAWQRIAHKGLKTLGAEETVQWSVKYYEKAGYAVKRLVLNDREWTSLGSVANQSNMFFLSAQDFWYFKSSQNQPRGLKAAITKASGIKFYGDAYMDIALKTDSPPTEVFYWITPQS